VDSSLSTRDLKLLYSTNEYQLGRFRLHLWMFTTLSRSGGSPRDRYPAAAGVDCIQRLPLFLRTRPEEMEGFL